MLPVQELVTLPALACKLRAALALPPEIRLGGSRGGVAQ
jgi:hypothetical protein